jgi:tRNA(Ile)-lysidine synthase TilS/MesJ
MKQFVESLGLPYLVEPAIEVYAILKAQQGNGPHIPCSICSRMKKAIIDKVAIRLHAGKVAFAHHADDAIETLFMNEIFGGRIATFNPKMILEKDNIEFIRPLIYVHEKTIIKAVEELSLPVIPSACPANGFTARQSVKDILSSVYEKYPFAQENFLTMLTNHEQVDLFYQHLALDIEGTQLSLVPATTALQGMILSDIRTRVFVLEQQVSIDEEFDGSDESAFNFILMKKDLPIGCIRYLIDEPAKVHLGRVAILKQYRGLGYGKILVKGLHALIKKRFNPVDITIHAQYHLEKFYQSLGYVSVGEPFLEAEIKHIKMVAHLE